MIKGVSRQVIIVKSPDPRLFEQAIFIVKEDAFQGGVSADEVLQEARRVADGYVKKHAGISRLFSHIPAPAYVAVGALMATIAWSFALIL